MVYFLLFVVVQWCVLFEVYRRNDRLADEFGVSMFVFTIITTFTYLGFAACLHRFV